MAPKLAPKLKLNWLFAPPQFAIAFLLPIAISSACISAESRPRLTPQTPPSEAVVARTLPDTSLSRRLTSDITTLGEILQQGNYLTQMEQWQGKALFLKVDETQNPAEFRYYAHHAMYGDRNQNGMVDPGDEGFFPPASTVKVAIAALVLEKLNRLDLQRDTEYRIIGKREWHSIAEDLRKMLVISDNESTNRLILWLGFEQLNRSLQAKNLQQLTITRLMLDRGTLVDSPPFEIRANQTLIHQDAQPVVTRFSCWERENQPGNCASASDILEVLVRLVQPEYFSPEERFRLTESDREWLREVMSHTPKEEGFNYADNYCRFLSEVERKYAHQSGRMLSKCGVALFSNTYIDSSFLETDSGEKYYLLFAVTPPESAAEAEVLHWMNQVTEFILPRLL